MAEQARRLELFTAAYGLTSAADRAMLLAVAQERLVALVEFMRERAAAGDAAFARHCAEGHDAIYRTDLAYLRAHAAALRG